MNNPMLLSITFHMFRRWKATVEYHNIKDIIHVKELLGHRNIQRTMVYITMEKVLFQYESGETHCKTASTTKTAAKLTEVRFDYVATFNCVMLFRRHE